MAPDRDTRAWARELDQHQLRYPDERVITFLNAPATRALAGDGARALDIGFGSGRHLRALMDHGFVADGVELIDGAPERARAGLGDDPRLGTLLVADAGKLPFPEATFSVIVAWGTQFLRPIDEMAVDLAALRCMLRPGGRLCVNYRATESWFCGLGRPLGDGTFVLDERAGAYAGMTYTFCDRPTAEALLEGAGFRVDDVERVELWKQRATKRHAWWTFAATRPA